MGQQRYVHIAPQYGHMGARVEWAGLRHRCHRLVCGIYPTQLAVSSSTPKSTNTKSAPKARKKHPGLKTID